MNNDKFEIVVIVGNGFDLNFELKTKYLDFLQSEGYEKLLLNNNKLASYLKAKGQLNSWIDIENELKNYSKGNNDTGDFYDEFKALKKGLCNYLKTIEYNDLNKRCSAYRLIKTLQSKSALIIDFNYTSTISTLLNNFNLNNNSEKGQIKHVKIHGTIENEDIIFGVEDDVIIPSNHIFLKKSTSKNFDSTNYSQFMKECKIFIVFGHSLGETDHTYFQDFFNLVTGDFQNKTIQLYYYGEESNIGLWGQIDKLTHRRIGKFRQQNKVELYDLKAASIRDLSQPSLS